MNFPDLGHLKQLQNSLWHWPRSRAAVMVGAGFSLNAEPLPGAYAKFLNWRDLAHAIYERLYPPQPDDSPEELAQRETKFDAMNFLRIASEYQAAFSKPRLDSLVLELTPDLQYVPGSLHRLLMDLPWADVFTTNYDTLLERAEVDIRAYYPVTKPSELTAAFSPRIVKLHGSHPSQTPLVVSEEDYRKYPREFAPFVNSVQQSLLENCFVLLGFSGDDPNFLEWTGWIRDELGDGHAPIYLVGPLFLGNAQRTLLTMRGVTPIDLSPIFADVKIPRQEIYSKSLEWFLRCLASARPHRPELWPKLNRRASGSSVGLPPLIGMTPEPEDVESYLPGASSPDSAEKLLRRWRFERESYPGWVVAPERTRSRLWDGTKNWVLSAFRWSESWPANKRILLFRELAWRFEVSMVPLLTEMVDPFRQALDQLLSTEPLADTFRDSEMAAAWLTVAFTMWRDARESYDFTLWTYWKERIDRVLRFDKTWTDRRNYEVALWQMWNVDRPATRAVLVGWQPSIRAPMAMIWKAGLLAELDELGEARAMLRSALGEIRKALRVQGHNIELLSIEGWCMFVLGATEQAADASSTSDSREEFRERWDELKAWDCSPWVLIEQLDNVLSGAAPQAHSGREETPAFDPGRSTVSYRLAHDDLTPLLPAFGCIRRFEMAGCPMHIAGLSITGLALKSACRWLASSHSFWSPAHLVRAGKLKDLSEDTLSRPQVATMKVDLAERIHNWCLQIFQSEFVSTMGAYRISPSQEDLLEVSAEVLSRLTLRIGREQLDESFQVALRFYRQVGLVFRPRLQAICEPWLRRIFEAATDDLLFQWLPDLIRAPLFEDGVPAGDDFWCDIMRNFPCYRCKTGQGDVAQPNGSISEATDWLLKRVTSESGDGRRRAVGRLICVYGTGLMSTTQQEKLGEIIWEHGDPTCSPDHPRYAVYTLLRLPAPSHVNVESVVKRYISELPVTGRVTRTGGSSLQVALRHSEEPLLLEASLASRRVVQFGDEPNQGVEWSSDEARCLLSKLLGWWDNDKTLFEPSTDNHLFSDAAEEVKRAGHRIGEFLSRIVLPRMGSAQESEWLQVLGFMGDLRAKGVYPTLALPYVLLHRSQEADDIARIIDEDLNSTEERRICAATSAIGEWLCLSAQLGTAKPPAMLLEYLVQRVVLRQKPGVVCSIYQVTRLLSYVPEAINPTQIGLLIASLIPWNEATLLRSSWTKHEGEFDEYERPALRKMIGELAAALSVRYEKLQPADAVPAPIKRWQEWCSTDPLPEVRRAFAVRRKNSDN